jgi:hypothetical protein
MSNQSDPSPREGGSRASALMRRPAVRAAAALAAVALVGTGVYLGVSNGSGGSAAPAPSPPPRPSTTRASSPPPGNPLTGIGTAGRVLTVKIDNVGEAQRQQTGLNSADIVYVIQVEGGLSRYLAVYDSAHAPSHVGPVRSARQTDIPLLAAYGRVGLAYSGAISGLLPHLAAANLQNITPDLAPALFSNGGESPTYITPAEIFAAYPHLAHATDVGFRFGAAPPGARPAGSATVSFPTASFTFTAAGTRWLVSVDGSPATTAGQGRTSADNVIIQHVHVVPGRFTDHNAGHPDNEVFSQTTGQGAADFYRDGHVWHGQWSKPTDASPTDYTVNGAPMQLAPGRTWIVLDGG